MSVELEPPPPAHRSQGRARPADPTPALTRTVLEPPRRWEWVNWVELWRFRELLFFLAWRDVKVRYKQTALGAAWAVLQPAMMMVVFTVFFGRLAGVSTDGLPQPVFFLTGVLPWFFFSTAVTNAANSVVGSERLITKVYFPRLAVPLAVGVLALLAAGLGTLLSALTVAYRDFRYVVPFFIQLGMFASPRIYMHATEADGRLVNWLVVLNPVNSLIETFRAGLVGGPIPWAGLGVSAAAAVAVFLAGCYVFRRIEDRFADVI